MPLHLSRGRDEQSREKQYHNQRHKEDAVLQRALQALLRRRLGVPLLVPEIGERNNEKTHGGVQDVEPIVDKLEREDDRLDCFRGGPMFLEAGAVIGRGRDEGDIDGKEADGSQKRGEGENTDDSDEGILFDAILVDFDL